MLPERTIYADDNTGCFQLLCASECKGLKVLSKLLADFDALSFKILKAKDLGHYLLKKRFHMLEVDRILGYVDHLKFFHLHLCYTGS